MKISLPVLLFFAAAACVSLNINRENVFPIEQAFAQTSVSVRPTSTPVLIAQTENGTVSTQSWWSERRERRGGENGSGNNGSTGGLLQMLLNLILQILNLIQQVIGGQNPSNNLIGLTVPTPSPTPNPNLVQMPNNTSNTPSRAVLPTTVSNVTPAPAQMGLFNPLSPGLSKVPATSMAPGISTAPITAPAPTLQPSTAPPPGGQAVVCNHTPSGDNYSGWTYDMTNLQVGDKMTTVWPVVALDCSQGGGDGSPWPGIGDTQSTPGGEQNLAQIGYDMSCSSGSPSYTTWTEFIHGGTDDGEVTYAGDNVNVGDKLTATLTWQGGGNVNMTMTDAQAGWTINRTVQFAGGYVPNGGEVINENNPGSSAMPHFSPVTFQTNIVQGGKAGPLSSGPNLQCYDMTNASTGDLNGTTFTSSYK